MVTLIGQKPFAGNFGIFRKNGQIYAQWGWHPSTEMDGWGTYNEASLVPVGDYAEDVSAIIRLRYSLDAEIALNRQRESKQAEWQEYYDFCEMAKAVAKEHYKQDGQSQD